jgi:hypothetical protein
MVGFGIQVLVAVVFPGAIVDDAVPPGFRSLFNGKDLSGWRVINGKPTAWGASDGVLFTTGNDGGWLMTEATFTNFEMRLEFKLPEKGNSGVALRSPLAGDPAYQGMEIQILDDGWHKANLTGLRPTQLTGSIYDIVGPSKDANKPIGQWNEMRIVAKDRHISIELNGTKIVDADLEKFKDRADKHPGILRESGHLGLQSHGSRVEFRRIRVKPL